MTTGEVAEQLRRIAEELGVANNADPSLLEVLAGIGVPIALGVATVIVAVLGLVESRRGRLLQRTLEDERHKRDDLARRLRYAEELRGWSQRALFEVTSDAEVFDGSALPDIKSRARADGVTSIDRIAKELWEIVEQAPDVVEQEPSLWMTRFNALTRLIEITLNRWIAAPELSADPRPIHARIAVLEAETTGRTVTLPPVKRK